MTAPSQQPPSSLFVQLFAKHQCALNSFIGSLVPTRADVDDVMQETSLALWKKWNDFDVSRDFFRWACGIAHIEVLRHRRKTATDRLWLCEELIELLSVEMLERTELFDMRRDALESCVKKLSTEDRAVVELRYQAGMTVRKMADALGHTPRTIHRTMARIRRLLHTCITATIREGRGIRS
ncbi:MAG: sigma-70 family RNA polymerase sigma factor [Planctomycetales bacterium]|nr:sigma-70 family RNA polymerase sigma factor [Planctomycetales bacterium]